MDRNDRNYFKRLTPDLIQSMFKGYDVPQNIRDRVGLIMRRFTIFGCCDGMYIANTIAKENASGDGCGHFDNAPVTRVENIAKALMGAYGCNIFPGDRKVLEYILANGSIPKELMISGLKDAIRAREEKIANTTDHWRKEFLYGEINVILDTIDEEENV